MKEFLAKLKEKVVVAIVGGSDLVKIKEQMGGDSCKLLDKILISLWGKLTYI